MSDCSPLSFSGMTPGVVTCCVKLATENGAHVSDPPPPSGSLAVPTSFGTFAFTWSFDAASETATIQCTDKPLLMPCFILDGAITHAVQKCGGTPA